MPAAVDALLFTSRGDAHGDAVAQALANAGASVVVGDLGWFVDAPLAVRPGESVCVGNVLVNRSTAIWFRRIGAPVDVPGMGELELRLRREEVDAIVFAGLDSLDAFWVDRPDVVARAEGKLWQLTVAARVGVPVPATLATSDVEQARKFAAAGPVLAKPASSGVGLAPFADLVVAEDLLAVGSCPVLLQRPVPALADLRVVVVGADAHVWRRARVEGQELDWRAVDAPGAGFVLVADDALARSAAAVAGALGLSMSVQDWVDDGDRTWFLEANPVGAWLFLDGAAELVPPALAALLMGGRP